MLEPDQQLRLTDSRNVLDALLAIRAAKVNSK